MRYSHDEINRLIIDSFDVIYFYDIEADKYYAEKTDERMKNHFGTEGSYHILMKEFMSGSMNKAISNDSAYSAFFDEATPFKGKIAKKAKMTLNGDEVIFQLFHIPIDDDKTGLILISYIEEEEYLAESRGDDKINAMKSAYLFSMFCDLKNDACSNMDMSELEDNPVNALSMPFTAWRETILKMFHESDQKEFLKFTDPQNIMDTLDYSRTRVKDFEMMNLEGKFIWVNLIFSRINTGNDDDFKVVFVVENVHEAHETMMKDMEVYKNMSMKDSLTGLFNHGRMEELLRELLKKSRKTNEPLSLIMMDIDHFKNVNDTFGHAVGDNVLKTFSGVCEKFLGTEKCKLGRWGGEEFIGICAGITVDQMEKQAEELRAMIEKRGFDIVGHITSSFGVIEVQNGETAEEAFKRVDAALYAAKEGGRNRVVRG